MGTESVTVAPVSACSQDVILSIPVLPSALGRFGMVRRSKTVSSFVIRRMQGLAESFGVPLQDFLARTRVTAHELQDPAARVGRARYERVLALTASVASLAPDPEPDLLHLLGTELPLVAGAWLNAPTLRAALELYLASRPLLGESDQVQMRERDGVVRIEYIAEDMPGVADFQAKGNFLFLIPLIRNYDLGLPTRFSAELSGAGPRRDSGFESLLHGKCVRSQSTNVLQFESHSLDVPYPRHNPAVERILGQRLAAELANLKRQGSLSLAVERAVRTAALGPCALMPGSFLSQLCSELGMSRSTLHRKLHSEGTSFKQLSRKARLDEAVRLLTETEMPLGEISDRLGFRSQGSFTRFFRREALVSPLGARHSAEAVPVLQSSGRGEGNRPPPPST